MKLKMISQGVASQKTLIRPVFVDENGNYWTQEADDDTRFIRMSFYT